MDSNSSEPRFWETEWTTDDIRNYSAKWTLAGDAGLLNGLQALSQSLLSRAREVLKDVDSLSEETKATDSKIHAAINEFLMLSNTQFVENRVYDDEVPEPKTAEKQNADLPKTKEEKEAAVVQQITEALRLGFQVLDTAFEKHEVVDSESEEDEEGNRTFRTLPVLRKKNPYAHRSLPYIIGTEKFMLDDKVGLGDPISEDESTEESEKEDTKDDEEMNKLSEDSAEDINSDVESIPRKDSKRSVRNIIPQSNQVQLGKYESRESDDDEGDLFGPGPELAKDRFSSGSEGDTSDSEQEAEVVNGRANFAAELAAKLSATQQRMSVAAPLEEEDEEEEEGSSDGHNQEIQKRHQSVRKSSSHKENAERRSSLRKNSKPSQKKIPVIPVDNYEDEDDEEDPLFKPKSGLFAGGGGLFDDLNDDSDLFGEESKPARKETIGRKHSKPRSGKEDRRLSDPSSLLGEDSSDLLNSIDKRSDKMETEKSTKTNRKVSLFDDVDGDDLFSSTSSLSSKVSTQNENSSQKSKESSLFDKDDEKDDLFADSSKAHLKEEAILPSSESTPKKKMPAGAVSTFGVNTNLLTAALKAQQALNDGDEEVKNKLRRSLSPIATEPTKKVADDSLTRSASNVTSDLFGSANESQNLFAPEKRTATTKPVKISLFDDDGDDEDDLFGSSSSTGNASRTSSVSNTATDVDPLANTNDSHSNKPAQEEVSHRSPKDSSKTERPRKVSLFDTDEVDGGDLFSSVLKPRAESKTKPVAKLRTRSLFEDEDVLFGGTTEEAPSVNLFSTTTDGPESSSREETIKRKNTGSLFDMAEDDEDLFSTQFEDSKHVGKPPIPTPRKGSLPKEETTPRKTSASLSEENTVATASPKKKPVGGVLLLGGIDPFAHKLKSLGAGEPNAGSGRTGNEDIPIPVSRKESVESSSVKIPAPTANFVSLSLNPLPIGNEISAVSFEEPVDAKTLQTACKGRAKIQVKRRPQSRKARQALTKSGVFDEERGDSNDGKPSTDLVASAPDKLIENPSNGDTNANLLSPSTEEEDVLPVDDLIVSKVTPPTVVNNGDHRLLSDRKDAVDGKDKDWKAVGTTPKMTAERKSTDLFDLGSDDDLFSSKPTKAPSLFSSKSEINKRVETSDDEDLFATPKFAVPTVTSVKPTSTTTTTTTNKLKKTKSIFDDDESDTDDSFAFTSSKKPAEISNKFATAESKSSIKPKAKGIFDDDDDDEDLFSDPLMANSK